ncbi:MAG: TIGR02281 family clan AA aspartic protease [Deltaproteobacteria bacterium]|nr:TIGR02281 family clan AA aspartic protease [Deltaproteobacteria bacterium]
MLPHKNNIIHVCPHCGVENIRAVQVEDLMGRENEGGVALCSTCNKNLYPDRNPELSDRENEATGSFSLRFFIIAGLLMSLMIYLNRTFGTISFKEDSGQIIYEIIIILIVSSSLASGKVRQNFSYLAIWAGIFLIAMVGYSYRYELSEVKEKVLAQVIPAKGFQKTPHSISFPLSSDGHFYIRAQVNGIPIIFLADTGASDIVLSLGDAEKLGIETDKLTFDRFYETANGRVRGSSIRLRHFKTGEIIIEEIRASVNEAKMRHSLLGMTFFKRLKSYEVKDDVLTLHWDGK